MLMAEVSLLKFFFILNIRKLIINKYSLKTISHDARAKFNFLILKHGLCQAMRPSQGYGAGAFKPILYNLLPHRKNQFIRPECYNGEYGDGEDLLLPSGKFLTSYPCFY